MDQIERAAEVLPSSGNLSVSGRTTARHRYSAGRRWDSYREKLYLWVPPESKSYTISTCGSGTDHAVSISHQGRQTIARTANSTCNGAEFTTSFTQGQPYVIVIDQTSLAEVAFTLTITEAE